VSEILTASQVEGAAKAGQADLRVPAGTIVTPLAKDRAQVLGLLLVPCALGVTSAGDALAGRVPRRRAESQMDVERLVIESKVRVVVRRVLLGQGRGVAELEGLVTAVMARLRPAEPTGAACGCEGRRST
jgi:hypothetical protein